MTLFILYVWRGDVRLAYIYRFVVRRLDLAIEAERFALAHGCCAKIIRQGDL